MSSKLCTKSLSNQCTFGAKCKNQHVAPAALPALQAEYASKVALGQTPNKLCKHAFAHDAAACPFLHSPLPAPAVPVAAPASAPIRKNRDEGKRDGGRPRGDRPRGGRPRGGRRAERQRDELSVAVKDARTAYDRANAAEQSIATL